MNLYTCTDRRLYWPVGGASIVVAENIDQAKELLEGVLKEMGLGGGHFTLQQVDMAKPQAIVLADGEY